MITTPITFAATIISALKVQCKIDFVDVDPLTGQMKLDSLQRVLNRGMCRGRTIIMPVHFAGASKALASIFYNRLHSFLNHSKRFFGQIAYCS